MSLRRRGEVLASASMVTVVADREADIYPAWASVPQAGFHLLSRAMGDRRLAGGGTLFNAAESFAVAGTRKIELPARPPDRTARTATVEMRFGEVEICRARDEWNRGLPKTVRLRLVEVREVAAPEGVEPLHWRLLTTHDVADAEKAWQIFAWYQARWSIEQVFRMTKSQGLQPEDSQLASADRLVKLAAAAVKAACIDRLCGDRNRHSRSAQPDAGRKDRTAEKPAPLWKPRSGLLGRRPPRGLELLL